MSFRRDQSDSVSAPRWRAAHQSLLLECGVPLQIATSDRSWRYVLLHGDDELESGWDPTWISPQQARKLLRVLQRDIPNPTGLDLIAALRRRASEQD